MRIAHGGTDVLVAHGLLHGIRIAVGRELQCAVSVADKVKRQICERGIISKYE